MKWSGSLSPRNASLGAGARGRPSRPFFAPADRDVAFQWPVHVDAIRAAGIAMNFPERTNHGEARVLHLGEVVEIRDPSDLAKTLTA